MNDLLIYHFNTRQNQSKVNSLYLTRIKNRDIGNESFEGEPL